ncbi:hypothetical protein G6F22_017329 [Rhizopus arrhizus]|nr:hypothetical protein G6F22_017329 [Rhizopus arrhizus]
MPSWRGPAARRHRHASLRAKAMAHWSRPAVAPCPMIRRHWMRGGRWHQLVHRAADLRRGDLHRRTGTCRCGGLHRQWCIRYRHPAARCTAGLLRRWHRLRIRLVGRRAGRHHPAGGAVPDAGPPQRGRRDLCAGGVIHHRRCQPVLDQWRTGGGVGRQGRTRDPVPPLPGLQRPGGGIGAAAGLSGIRGAGLDVTTQR